MPVSLFAPRRAVQPAGGPGEAGVSPDATRAPDAASSLRKDRATTAAAKARPSFSFGREAAALVLLASALFVVLALASFEADPMRPEITGPDWVGPVGSDLALALVGSVGIIAWLLPVELAVIASPLLQGQPSQASLLRVSGDIVVSIVLAALVHVAFPELTAFGAMPGGGAVGELFGEILRVLFSTVGSYIIGLTVVGLILVGRSTFSFIELAQKVEQLIRSLGKRGAGGAKALASAWSTARDIERRGAGGADPVIEGPPSSPDAIIAALTDSDAETPSPPAPPPRAVVTPPAPPVRAATKREIAREGVTPAAPAARAAVTREVAREAPAAVAASSSGPSIAWSETALAWKPEAASAPPAEIEADTPTPEPAPKREKRARAGGSAAVIAAPPIMDPLIADPLIADPLDEIDASIEAEPRVTAKRSTTEPRVAEAIEEKKPAQKRSARRSPIETPPRERDDELHPSGKTAEEIITDILTPTPDRAPTPEPDRDVDASPSDDPAPEEEQDLAAEPPAPADLTKHPRPKSPRVVDTTPAAEPEKAVKPEIIKVVPAINKGFRLPTPDMLEPPPGGRFVIDEQQLKATAQMLEKTLSDYGVNGRVEEIHPGPTVTTFEVSPAAGTKVSKVAGLADDLALGLSKKVRIVAPIPGKNRIGFEIPNEQRVPVNMRELVEDRRFLEMNAPLPCVLGRDIIGAPYFADLASMPHVIVAGATGAGKSVGLNVMLVSLLFRKTPEDLRLLMIDPKVVELAPFDRIPHMLLPVVTDMKQAANALKWAVDEMERRYQLFANAGTKNITTYNAWVEKVKRGEARPPKPPAKVSAVAADGTEVMVDAAKDGTDAALPEKLPFIVIVVDEFADLMMQQGKDVEASVARLAQKARAAGMHVILATQRPSVDVITGMIKANFPTRIAFRVAQKVDSRTILDEQGAEHLLGRGDMLVKMNGSNETRRVQCPFCSEEEVQRITDFLRLQGEPVYDEAILRPRDEEGQEQADTSDAEADPMYDAAVRIVADTRRCSTSWIQRKLGIGYNRAAKIVEAMEKHGLVGPANGAKDREVLISPI